MNEVKPPFDGNIVTLDEAYGLYLLLIRTKDVMHKAREDELRQGNISSSAEASVLFLVEDLGRTATPAEISRRLFRNSNGISTLISRMERRGLVRKVKDLDRKNQVRVELTEEGRRACKHAEELGLIHRIMYSLSKNERRQLSLLLHKVCDKACDETGVDSKLLKGTLPHGY